MNKNHDVTSLSQLHIMERPAAILLVQYNSAKTSRTYLDFASTGDALDGICKLYEDELRILNPGLKHMTYDIADIYAYIEQLADLSLQVCVSPPACHLSLALTVVRVYARSYHEPIKAYQPRQREWIKKTLFNHLRQQS